MGEDESSQLNLCVVVAFVPAEEDGEKVGDLPSGLVRLGEGLGCKLGKPAVWL